MILRQVLVSYFNCILMTIRVIVIMIMIMVISKMICFKAHNNLGLITRPAECNEQTP